MNSLLSLRRNSFIALGLIFISYFSFGQNGSGTYTLKQAIDYALDNNFTVTNSILDKGITLAQERTLRSVLFPQVNADVNYNHNFKVQSTILENGVVSNFTNPNLPYGTVTSLRLGLKNQFLPSVSASQVIFDQSYFTSLKASRVSRELSEKNISSSKIEVAHAVTRAYYGVLVNEKQLSSLDASMASLDSLYRETYARYEAGLARKIDVDRIEVSFNNLRQEREKVIRQAQISRALLYFQMNIPRGQNIMLSDSLDEGLLKDFLQTSEAQKVNYSNRIEYSIIESQRRLNELDLSRTRAGHYPRLTAVGTFGYNPAASRIADLTQSERWIYYSFVGFRLSVPVFNGFALHHQTQEKKLALEKTENNRQLLERTIDLQVDESLINLNNSVESLKIQKRNLDLAEENLKVLKAEYEHGLAMNVEITSAEASLKEAQTNYYQALYSALLSKADYERAMGTLLK